jgi:hypothetical protein
VTYDKFILSVARWVLTKEETKEFEQVKEDELIARFSLWRSGKKIPDYVLLSQGDNELFLHLENQYCIKLLLNELNKSESVMLTETLEHPGHCWIGGPDGRYAGEFIAAFSKPVKARSVPDKQGVESRSRVARYFPVGSEWLFAKIYCGTKTAERILCEAVKPFTETLLAEGCIDSYFFIRYHDEGNHLRVRFHHGSDPGFWKDVIDRLQALMQPYQENHTVSNIQFETYQRKWNGMDLTPWNSVKTCFIIIRFQSLISSACWMGMKGNSTGGRWP